jgi:hypothetical protein
MVAPVSTLISALDRSVAKLSARAFEAAVRAEMGPEREANPQKELLLSVQAGDVTAETPGVKEAVASGLVTINEDGSLGLTPLGEYLLPPAEAAESDPEEEARGRKPSAPAAA